MDLFYQAFQWKKRKENKFSKIGKIAFRLSKTIYRVLNWLVRHPLQLRFKVKRIRLAIGSPNHEGTLERAQQMAAHASSRMTNLYNRTSDADKPFFLYLAYNAPHSAIVAPADQVAKYRGKYLKGWDVVRKERFEKQKAIGLAGPGWHLTERPMNIPAWDTLDAKSQDFEDLRMATYAAMVD